MNIRNTLLLVALVCIFAIGPRPSFAQWSQDQIEEFVEGCEDSCRKNDNVTGPNKDKCVNYCTCVAEGGARVAPDYDKLNEDFEKNPNSPAVEAFRSVIPGCNARVFGG
ncbi:MAG: hypothetical protein KF794_12805 [Xanthobacteraceae bacterium]|nr:hypothetical protein [Xanthobacteraceae bacterium]QYK44634.1 MAG: hypothetical protein KF794_12805 [Xanthobacteraceae bacterium]